MTEKFKEGDRVMVNPLTELPREPYRLSHRLGNKWAITSASEWDDHTLGEELNVHYVFETDMVHIDQIPERISDWEYELIHGHPKPKFSVGDIVQTSDKDKFKVMSSRWVDSEGYHVYEAEYVKSGTSCSILEDDLTSVESEETPTVSHEENLLTITYKGMTFNFSDHSSTTEDLETILKIYEAAVNYRHTHDATLYNKRAERLYVVVNGGMKPWSKLSKESRDVWVKRLDKFDGGGN